MSEKKTYYISTPIYYPSAKLHIGHAYCTVAADAEARFRRLDGYDVMFLTGTDEHGQKIERTAIAAGKTPKEYVDVIVEGIHELWAQLNISHDRFIRTTDDYHKKSIQVIFKQLYDRGDIYKENYEGWYCTPCESFWTDHQLVDGNCPDCGRPVELTKEESYFFRLSKYQKRLEEHYEKHPTFISPPSRLNEMLNNFIRPGLEDLCVSRTSFKWGIPVPFDEKHVVYVWVDALSNYITALGYGSDDDSDFKKYWPVQVHLVGKEIVRFHTIIWPAILMALDLPLPEMVFGHGWLLLEGGKMSKSKGNVVDPALLAERYGTDAFRYFLLREVAFGSDGIFSNEALISRINADLANDLGNLVSRTLTMGENYFGGNIGRVPISDDFGRQLKEAAEAAQTGYRPAMEKLQFQDALAGVFKLVSRANKYIDETMPWKLAKSKDEADRTRLQEILYNLCEAIRIAGILLQPAIPEAAAKMLSFLGLPDEDRAWESAFTFGETKGFATRKGEILFPRIDLEKELVELEAFKAKREAAEKGPQETGVVTLPEITIEDFAKIQLRVAKVVNCSAVEKSDKLLRLELDLDGESRTIATSVREWYKPEDLIDRNIILVSNLKKATFRGVESHGMLLACENGKNDVKIIFADDCRPGAPVN
ncbi:MAG: methionine--tRNA ligase [Clostridiales bacterium]|nr:methionine--tRNA ligase [Clostridiales bacterium]